MFPTHLTGASAVPGERLKCKNWNFSLTCCIITAVHDFKQLLA